MSSALRTLFRSYLSDLQREYERGTRSGEATPELSYRAPLDSLLRKIPGALRVSDVERIYEPRKQAKAGRPDWRFHNRKSMAIYGYVEAKGLDPRSALTPSAHHEQVQRYLSLGHRLIMTDGLDFVFYEPAARAPQTVPLIKKPLRKGAGWTVQDIDPRLETSLRAFFSSPTTRVVSSAEIVRQMAAYARSIATNVKELIRIVPGAGIDKDENAAIKALHDLRALLRIAHDPDLSEDERFADMVAQTLVFGLLYAHRRLLAYQLQPPEMAKALSDFWSEAIRKDGANRLRPFRALAEAGGGRNRLGPITTWHDDCVLYLSHVQVEKAEEPPDYHSLYEQFLKAYDPAVREDFGAYATPKVLAEYIVAFCEFVARESFNKRTLFDAGNKIIDPACGTGQFLEEFVAAMRRAGASHDNVPTVAGFEILPAPYALAQYRMAELSLRETPLTPNVSVILCNSLANYVVDGRWTAIPNGGSSTARRLLEDEGKEAASLAKPPITAIIGNPPSSERTMPTDERTYGRILALLEDFRPPRMERTSRQNIQKQIQNPFVKFLRWACHKVPGNAPSIVAFVVPGSFLGNRGYASVRRWLISHFEDIWVVELDKDLRTGVRAENLFATRQSRAVLICSRERAFDGEATVRYLSILERSKAQKVSYFSGMTSRLIRESKATIERSFNLISPTAPDHRLCPEVQREETTYSSFWNLVSDDGAGVFLRHSSGLKLGITAALVHADRSLLLRRSSAIGQPQSSYEALIEQWFTGQRKPPTEKHMSAGIREDIGQASNDSNVFDYSFRPFLNVHALLPVDLLQRLANSGGGGTRYRPEVMAAYAREDNFGIAVAPGPKDIGEDLHRFATLAWHLPDNDLCARNNAHVFCLYFPEYKNKKKEWSGAPKLNVSSIILRCLGDPSGNSVELAQKVVFYVFAILCSPYYLRRFSGDLFHTAGDWPKIPFAKDRSLFDKIAAIGQNLAELERNPATHNLIDSLKRAEKALPSNEIALSGFKINAEAGSITLRSADGTTYLLPGLPSDILSLKISGYDVIQEWLKWHTKPYLTRAFRHEDGLDLLRLISALSHQQSTITELGSHVELLLRDPKRNLLTPTPD